MRQKDKDEDGIENRVIEEEEKELELAFVVQLSVVYEMTDWQSTFRVQ